MIQDGLYEIVALLKDKFLNGQNYEEWRFHMTWALLSQDLWHVARGQHLSEITLDKDYLVSKSIKLTIEYPLSLKIWQATFCSSQELWDYLRSEFGQDNQHKKKQQTKEKEKRLESSLTVSSDRSNCMLPVPEIHDFTSDSSCLGNILEEAISMGNTQVLDQSDLLPAANTSFQSCKGISPSIFSDLDLQYEMLDSTCLLENNEITDQFRETTEFMEIAASTDLEQHQDVIVESEQDDLHVACLHQHRDEIFEHQVYTADFKDELVLQLPWMDIYEQNAGFSSIITKVSKHEVDFPLYIHLHIPFACTHDGKVEDHSNLDDCLGYISYPGIGGLTNRLKVSYRCLHLRNQVLVALELLKSSNLISSHDLAANSPHLFQGQFQTHEQILISEMSKGTGRAHIGVMHDCLKFPSATILAEQFQFFKLKCSSKGMHFSVGSQNKCREWYRGRKIWFKTNISWPAWLLLWLTLLHMLNSSTAVLSLQQCLSPGGMILRVLVIRGDVRILYSMCYDD